MHSTKGTKYFKAAILAFLAVSLAAGLAFAEEKVGFVKRAWHAIFNIVKKPIQIVGPVVKPAAPAVLPEQKGEKAESPMDKISEKEIRERIKGMLEAFPEAKDFIPELKVTADEKENIIKIEYRIDGLMKNIDELGKETLIKIHNRINTERVRMQTERIEKQLEAVRASQNVPKVPQIFVPPAPPRIPAAPSPMPKVPAPPPAPVKPPQNR